MFEELRTHTYDTKLSISNRGTNPLFGTVEFGKILDHNIFEINFVVWIFKKFQRFEFC